MRHVIFSTTLFSPGREHKPKFTHLVVIARGIPDERQGLVEILLLLYLLPQRGAGIILYELMRSCPDGRSV